MKKIKFGSVTLLILIIILVVACCSSSNEKKELPALKHSVRVAQCEYGILSKVEDGSNIIYVYERSGGAGSITVINR